MLIICMLEGIRIYADPLAKGRVEGVVYYCILEMSEFTIICIWILSILLSPVFWKFIGIDVITNICIWILSILLSLVCWKLPKLILLCSGNV